ncbi:MAG: flavin reductase family protein [Planctomycetota bacterium]
MELSPAELSIRDRYKLLIGCIVPRPIAFVSTLSPEGAPNLAPFSFFNGIGSNPMTILFCPANKSDGSEKDTLRNCKPVDEGGTGEFVVCASIEDYAREIAASAEPLAYGESEFELTGLASAPSVRVRPPRVARAPWAFECETMQVIRTHPGAAGGGNVVLGRVVHIYVDERVIDRSLHVDAERLHAIGRIAGIGYTRATLDFELPLGRAALSSPAERTAP